MTVNILETVFLPSSLPSPLSAIRQNSLCRTFFPFCTTVVDHCIVLSIIDAVVQPNYRKNHHLTAFKY
jgi:hypothetical protein